MNRLIRLIKAYIERRLRSRTPQGLVLAETDISERDIDSQGMGNATTEVEDTTETMFRTISRETTLKKPIKVIDQGFISRDISIRETEQGLERQVQSPLIIAACGKVIREEDIGVKCSECGQYDEKEHALICNFCGRALCIIHTRFFKNEEGRNVPYCARHYKQIVENQDTWKKLKGNKKHA